MPKIRLSALATDIKGKSGGSVFSTNAGGTYFRNNPSGTGSKKAGTSVRKQLFASLSQSWRNLSNAQQVAWADAGVLYPTTNAWGETRIPKGFELFMRLNGNLQAAGETLLLVPVTPRAIPALGSPTFTYSDLFQLIPQHGYLSTPPNLPDYPSYGNINNFRDSEAISLDEFFGLRFSLNNSDTESFSGNQTIELFEIWEDSLNYQRFYLQPFENGTYKFISKLTLGTFENICQSNPIYSNDLKDVHFGIQTFVDYLAAIELSINGVSVTMSQSTSGEDPGVKTSIASLILGRNTTINVQSVFQDFRTYAEIMSYENIDLISKGYILGSEKDAIPMYQIQGFSFENFCTDRAALQLAFPNANPVSDNIYIHEFTPELVPNIIISAALNTESGLKLQILTSDFVSPGKNVISTTKKTIGYFPFLDIPLFTIYRPLKSLLKFTIGGTTLFLQARYLDITSGAVGVVSDVLPVGKPKPRFKAGAELSGKVN